jgi:hypothetical protein
MMLWNGSVRAELTDPAISLIDAGFMAAAGRLFLATTNFTSTGVGVPANLALFRNPAGSGVNCAIQRLVIMSNASGNHKLRVYRGPTVTANGGAVTSVGGRTTGQAAVNCLLTTLPTTTASGDVFYTAYTHTNSGMFVDYMNGTLIVEPNTAILFNMEQSVAGQAASLNLEWSEKP